MALRCELLLGWWGCQLQSVRLGIDVAPWGSDRREGALHCVTSSELATTLSTER